MKHTIEILWKGSVVAVQLPGVILATFVGYTLGTMAGAFRGAWSKAYRYDSRKLWEDYCKEPSE